MRRITSLCVFVAFCATVSFASFERTGGGLFLAGFPRFGSISPTFPSRRTFSAWFSPGLFGIPELTHAAVEYREPFTFGTLGLGGTRLGFSLYREWTFDLSLSVPVLFGLSVGGVLRWHGLSIEGYGSDGTVGVDAECLLRIAEDLSYAVSLRNLNRPTIGALRDPLPQTITMAVGYTPVSALSMLAVLEKDSDFPAAFRFAAQYVIARSVRLGGGINFGIPEYAARLGVEAGPFLLGYEVTVHPCLGPTHSVSVALDLTGG